MTRRQLRLARTTTVVLAAWWVLPRAWAGWATLTPWAQSSVALFVGATVLTVWGVWGCLREYREEQLRAAMDRHPAGRRASSRTAPAWRTPAPVSAWTPRPCTTAYCSARPVPEVWVTVVPCGGAWGAFCSAHGILAVWAAYQHAAWDAVGHASAHH